MKSLRLAHDRGEDEESAKDADLIIELPDHVLCSILALLPMKDRVKTSILSSRWRYQWASTPYLDFDTCSMNERMVRPILSSVEQDEEGLRVLSSEFVRYGSKILQLYRGPKILSFTVSCVFNQLISCHLDQWIEFAIANGVESMKLNFLKAPRWTIRRILDDKLLYNFPCHGTSSTLKHLQLRICVLPGPASFNGFRTLVSLDLQYVNLINENCSAGSLFSSCLLLEVFRMRRCALPDNFEAVDPFVKNLKCLEIYGCFHVKNILVSAMNLTTFVYDGGSLLNLSLDNVPKLKKLHLNITGRAMHIIPSVLAQLPKALPQFESLFIKAAIEIRTRPAVMLASFVNVKELELRAFSELSPDLLWIVSTIDALPLLQKLHVMLSSGIRRHDRLIEERKMKTRGLPHNQLKEILITGFDLDCLYQTELVICLLKNAVALEPMTIDTNERYYSTFSGRRELISSSSFPERVWDEREMNQFFQVLHREDPGSEYLVTICKH